MLFQIGALNREIELLPDTNSLYIDLSERPSTESREISESIVLDYDAEGKLVGIDIDNASNKVEMNRLNFKQNSRQG